jgi:hypothetical protein
LHADCSWRKERGRRRTCAGAAVEGT